MTSLIRRNSASISLRDLPVYSLRSMSCRADSARSQAVRCAARISAWISRARLARFSFFLRSASSESCACLNRSLTSFAPRRSSARHSRHQGMTKPDRPRKTARNFSSPQRSHLFVSLIRMPFPLRYQRTSCFTVCLLKLDLHLHEGLHLFRGYILLAEE